MGVNALVPLSASVIYIGLLIVIALDRRWQKQHKLFALYLVAAIAWSFSTFLLRSDLLTPHKLHLFRIVVIASVAWVIQLYYFVRAFLNQRSGLAMYLGYVSLVVSIILAVFGFWPEKFSFHNGVVTPYLGWYGFLYVATLVVYHFLGLYSLTRRHLVTIDPKERNKIAYLIVAICLLVMFGLVGVTPLADNFPISHLGGLFSALIFTYAIMKHELVDLNSILRRGLGWASLFIVGAALYALLFYMFELLLDLKLEPLT